MSKLQRFVVYLTPTDEAHLKGVIAEREACANDRAAALRAGVIPPANVILDAPLLEGWETYPNPGGGLGFGLHGVCPWHTERRRPHERWTSPVHVLDEVAGIAITEGGYYRLGKPLSLATDPEPVDNFPTRCGP